jgi:hypothetical protein
MPPWINDKVPKDMLWGIGASRNTSPSLRLTMAETAARSDIARQLQTMAQGMISNYQRESGSINDTAVIEFQESVTRQLAQATFTGSARELSWTAPDGKTLWVRVKLSKTDAAKSVAAEVNKLVANEASRYAAFKAMDALKMMDAALNKYNSRPEPVLK